MSTDAANELIDEKVGPSLYDKGGPLTDEDVPDLIVVLGAVGTTPDEDTLAGDTPDRSPRTAVVRLVRPDGTTRTATVNGVMSDGPDWFVDEVTVEVVDGWVEPTDGLRRELSTD